jgi:hypothetical protein
MHPHNPYFDENKVVWRDEYSGRYPPPPTGYDEQFNLQWKLALEGRSEYLDNPESVTRFNSQVARANIMEIPREHPEWVEAFDFANCWGVAMCTHDPLETFRSAAATVKPGGPCICMSMVPRGFTPVR